MAERKWRRQAVGGGKAFGFPKPRPHDLSLNIDAHAMPDIQGDIGAAPFPSLSFAEVYFEKVPYDAFTGENLHAIKEAARLLTRHGRLIIETGRNVPLAELRRAMRLAGFKPIRVADKGFVRISGRLGRP